MDVLREQIEREIIALDKIIKQSIKDKKMNTARFMSGKKQGLEMALLFLDCNDNYQDTAEVLNTICGTYAIKK